MTHYHAGLVRFWPRIGLRDRSVAERVLCATRRPKVSKPDGRFPSDHLTQALRFDITLRYKVFEGANDEAGMVQTLWVVSSSDIDSGSRGVLRCGDLLHQRLSRDRSPLTLGERHTLRCVPVFRLSVSARALGRPTYQPTLTDSSGAHV